MGAVRFPFTFMGLLALGFGLWILAYAVTHQRLDPLALGIAWAAGAASLAFAAYVLVRRLRRGPEG